MESNRVTPLSADDQNRAKAKAKFKNANDCNNPDRLLSLYRDALNQLLEVKERTADDRRNLSEYAYQVGTCCNKSIDRDKYFNLSGIYLSSLPINEAIKDWRSHALRAQETGARCKKEDDRLGYYEHALNCFNQIPTEQLNFNDPVIIKSLKTYFQYAQCPLPEKKGWVKEAERNDLPKLTQKGRISSSFSAVKDSPIFSKKSKYQKFEESSEEEKNNEKKEASSSTRSKK